MIYTGIHILKVDNKGRLSIPAVFRHDETGEIRLIEHPASPVVIGHVVDGFSEQMASLSTIFSKTVNYKKDGRVCLPKELRDYIGSLDTDCEVAMVGMGNHFQIWSLANWKKVEPEYKARLVQALMRESVWVPPTSDKNG